MYIYTPTDVFPHVVGTKGPTGKTGGNSLRARRISSLRFSEDGQFLAAGCWDQEARGSWAPCFCLIASRWQNVAKKSQMCSSCFLFGLIVVVMDFQGGLWGGGAIPY